jgi:hypothetical protein
MDDLLSSPGTSLFNKKKLQTRSGQRDYKRVLDVCNGRAGRIAFEDAWS